MHVWQLGWGIEAGKNVEGKPGRQPKHSPCDGIQESSPRGGCAAWKRNLNGTQGCRSTRYKWANVIQQDRQWLLTTNLSHNCVDFVGQSIIYSKLKNHNVSHKALAGDICISAWRYSEWSTRDRYSCLFYKTPVPWLCYTHIGPTIPWNLADSLLCPSCDPPLLLACQSQWGRGTVVGRSSFVHLPTKSSCSKEGTSPLSMSLWDKLPWDVCLSGKTNCNS